LLFFPLTAETVCAAFKNQPDKGNLKPFSQFFRDGQHDCYGNQIIFFTSGHVINQINI